MEKGGFEIGHDSNRLTFSNFAMTSALTSRYDHLDDKAVVTLLGSFGKDSRIDHMWIEHFECGAWIGDYACSGMRYTDHLVIENSRIRNNLAGWGELYKELVIL